MRALHVPQEFVMADATGLSWSNVSTTSNYLMLNSTNSTQES